MKLQPKVYVQFVNQQYPLKTFKMATVQIRRKIINGINAQNKKNIPKYQGLKVLILLANQKEIFRENIVV